jgi:transposase
VRYSYVIAMRYIHLNPVQYEMLSLIRRKSEKPSVRDRAFSLLLSSQGQTVSQLSQCFDVHRNTIHNWFNAFEANSLVGLYDESGRGNKSKLQSEHEEAILTWIKESPQNLDYLIHKVAQHFQLRVSRWTIKRYLKSQGLTWRRVRRGLPKQEEPQILEKKEENSSC